MIVALIAFILSGLKNAQFAQSQSKATKLAQETMEQIKTIRDRDESVSFSPTAASKFSDLWSINMSQLCAPTGYSSGPCYFVDPLLTGNSAVSNVSTTLDNQFTRQILIEDNTATYATEKKLTVKVKWIDSSGDHESNIQTILTKI